MNWPIKIYFVFIVFMVNKNVVNCEDVTIPGLGTIKGSTTSSTWSKITIYQFLGIPYAESPEGELRFKAPKNKAKFTSPFDATLPGRSCPETDKVKDYKPEDLINAEDCLHLSVYTLDLDSSTQRPVMIFIHGGGFESGTSTYYYPNFLLEKEIVLVAFNYRLGPLGFLSTQSQEIPGNAGFLDTIMAIQWVKQYIQYFGGNPNHITIFGESAGAGLVSALVLSADSLVPHNLFQGAILQSGSLFGAWAFDDDPITSAERVFKNVDKTKCLPPNDTIDKCFMNLDLKSLFEAYNAEKAPTAYGINSRPSYSTDVFPYKPQEILNGAVEIRNISLMAGVTKHDGLFVLESTYEKLVKNYDIENNSTFNTYDLLNMVAKDIGVDDYSGTFNGFASNNLFTQDQLINGNFTEMLPGLKDLACDIAFKAPTLRAAQLHAKYYPTQTFVYTFDYHGEISFIRNESSPFSQGVLHADDLLFLFPFSEYKLNDADRKVSDLFVDLWTSFAIDGVPKSNNAPKWPPLERYTGPYIHIDSKSVVGDDFLTEFNVITREANSANSVFSNIMVLTVITSIVVILL